MHHQMYQDTFVSFIGVPDDPAVELFALTRLERLKDSAPSDSVISVILSKYNGEFRAHLRLRARDLSFSLFQNARSPFMAMEKVFNESRMEIQRWVAHRDFENMEYSQGGEQ